MTPADDAGTPPFVLPSPAEVDRAESEVGARYYDEVIGLFDRMLRHREYRQRLQEFFVGAAEASSLHGRVDLVINGEERRSILDRDRASSDHTVVVPVLWSTKGTFYNNLVVRDASGARLPLLSQAEVTALVSTTLGVPLGIAFPGLAGTPPFLAALDELRRLINVKDVVPADDFDRLFADALGGIREHADDETLETLRHYCRFFADGYILAVQAPLTVGCHIGVDYSFNISAPPDGRRTFDEKLKTVFGLESQRTFVPLAGAASLFQTYHLSMGASAGRYDSRHAVYLWQGQDFLLTTPDELEEQAPGTQLEVRDTDTNADPHLFLRTPPAASTLGQKLGWEVTYAEKPPGALVPVLTMALSATVISLVLAVTLPRLQNVDLNAPTLALAVPIFAITLFGFSFDRLFRSSAHAVYGFFAAALITIVSTILTVVGHPPGWLMVRVGPYQVYYLLVVCSLAGLVVSAWLVVVLRQQFRYYRGRLDAGSENPWRRSGRQP
ncbi:MAG TPA: hypothetical protein VGH99_16230 [Pseudonocardia sp.]